MSLSIQCNCIKDASIPVFIKLVPFLHTYQVDGIVGKGELREKYTIDVMHKKIKLELKQPYLEASFSDHFSITLNLC